MYRWFFVCVASLLLAACSAHQPARPKASPNLQALIDTHAIAELVDVVDAAKLSKRDRAYVLEPLHADRLPAGGPWTAADPQQVNRWRTDIGQRIRGRLPESCESRCLGAYQRDLPRCTGEEEICSVEITYRLCLLRCRLNRTT